MAVGDVQNMLWLFGMRNNYFAFFLESLQVKCETLDSFRKRATTNSTQLQWRYEAKKFDMQRTDWIEKQALYAHWMTSSASSQTTMTYSTQLRWYEAKKSILFTDLTSPENRHMQGIFKVHEIVLWHHRGTKNSTQLWCWNKKIPCCARPWLDLKIDTCTIKATNKNLLRPSHTKFYRALKAPHAFKR